MNAKFVFLIALAAAAVVSGFPAAADFEEEARHGCEAPDLEEIPSGGCSPEEEAVRVRRATCDLLSVSTSFGSLNHAACAAHCLAMRRKYRGGRCKNGVCHCRR